MFWCYGFLSFLLLGDTYGDVSKSRERRQISPPNGQVIDNIFKIPITAIKQTAAVAQAFSPENTHMIDSVFKIPVSTLEAVGTLVKSTAEQRRQNAEDIQRNRQERRDRLLARKEQKWKRKEEFQNQRLQQQQLKRVVRHKDPFGLDALSDLLVGHHGLLSGSGFLGHHPELGGIHQGGHRHRKGHGFHGSHDNIGLTGNRPQNTYEVYEDVNEDTSFSWHGITAGVGSFFGTRPSSSTIKIENKVAPKEKKEKTPIYSSNDVNLYNKIAKIKSKPERGDPPLENKIAPRSGKVTFV
ncbi:PREDICTED: uncharacterized protein LOC106744976 [Dinoponera quadriceps]|uniref:Uncharacterized protein LOC106744976 n=1 Tax=Dinoponera quadriceps TaxID=609295 RepID=A0A6P3XBM3_DINQU|nr:PREDICTED: uncharacterized protein LOC106744976 [Dinoponera quadriceps]